MGEAKKHRVAAVQEALVAMSVQAFGARVQVRWNQGGHAIWPDGLPTASLI